MLPYSDSRLTKIALACFFLLIIGYAYYEARGLLYGPVITVDSQVAEMHDQFVHIKGSASRIASLSMNGTDIAVTEAGDFDEPYLLSAGYNRIVLNAKDKYGNQTSRAIEIMYTPTSTPRVVPPHTGTATSTHATSTTPTTTVAH